MLQNFQLTWKNNSIGLDEQRIYVDTDFIGRIRVGTVAPEIRKFVFEHDYGDTATLNFYVESMAVIKGVENRAISIPVEYKIIPKVKPYIFIVNPSNRTSNTQITIENGFEKIEVVDHPEIQVPSSSNFFSELRLPTSINKDITVKVYPINNNTPLGAINFNGMLVEVVQWSSSGHAPSITEYNDTLGYNQYLVNHTALLKRLPNEIHPSITSLDYFIKRAPLETRISDWDVSNITSMRGTFQYTQGSFWDNNNISDWNTGKVTSMAKMLQGTNFNQPIGNWDTSNVTDMSYMFQNTYSINQSLTKWNTSKVTDMSYMFDTARQFNGDITGWDTSSVVTMTMMFNYCDSFNQDISNWNVSNVVDMSFMFLNNWLFDQPIGKWNTASLINMEGMFLAAYKFNQPLNDWNTSNVTNMSRLFDLAKLFNQDLGKWDTSNVTLMRATFSDATAFNKPLSTWVIDKVTDMSKMFFQAMAFNQPIGNWNTGNVTTMSGMFDTAIAFDQPIGTWNVSKVTDMSYMFRQNGYSHPLNDWDTSSLTNIVYMFSGATKFNQDLDKWDVSKVTSLENLFNNASIFNANISTWNVSNVKSMRNFASYASLFNSDISGWDVSKVTTMEGAFRHAESFDQDLSGWNVISVTNMAYMFNRATSFTQSISNWNTQSVDNMNNMFEETSSTLAELNLSGWCVHNILTRPTNFRSLRGGTVDETLDPVWGTCESMVDPDPYVPFTFKIARHESGLNLSAHSPFIVRIFGYPDYLSEGVSWNETYHNLDIKGTFAENTIVRVYPVDRSKPIAQLSVASIRIKHLMNWNESGHSFHPDIALNSGIQLPSNNYRATYQVYMSGSDLEYVPDELHPSITCLTGILYKAKKLKKFPAAWDTSNVTDMTAVLIDFGGAPGFDLSGWDVSNVKLMHYAFNNANIAGANIADWNTGNVTNMAYMFSGTGGTHSILNGWDVSKVTDMNYMFYNNQYINQDLNQWNTASLEQCEYMFGQAGIFNGNISTWNVSKVKIFFSMFYRARAFNNPLNDWDMSNARALQGMFNGAAAFNQPLDKWNTARVANFREMFSEAISFKQDLSMWCTTLVDGDSYSYGNFIKRDVHTLPDEYYPVWGSCPRGEDQQYFCVPEIININNVSVTVSDSDVIGLAYQIDETPIVRIKSAIPAGTYAGPESVLLTSANANNPEFINLVLGTLVITNTTISSKPIPPITDPDGGVITFYRNTDPTVTTDIFAKLFNTTNNTVQLSVCTFGIATELSLASSSLIVGVHIKSVLPIDKKSVLVYNPDNGFVGTLENVLTQSNIITLTNNDTELKFHFEEGSFAGYRFVTSSALQNVPFYVLPELPEETNNSFKPMIISGNLNSVRIYSESPLNIRWPEGTSNIAESNVSYDPEVPLYEYTGYVSMPGMYGGRIEISHMDRVSKIRGFAMTNAGSYIEQWYSGGYDGFITPTMLAVGVTSVMPMVTRVPNIAPPNTVNLAYLFNGTYSFNQDLSKWCVTDILTKPTSFVPSDFDTAKLPVWGTCPVAVGIDTRSMLLTLNYEEVTISAESPLSIDWGPSAKSTDIDNHFIENGMHVYTHEYVDLDRRFLTAEQKRITVTHEDGVSKIAKLSLQGIERIDQWYAGGYDGFTMGGFTSVYYLPTMQPPNTTNYSYMFAGASYTMIHRPDLWDMSQATDMSYMFYSSTYFNQDISSWNVGAVTNMNNMLYGASYFNQDLSQWCVGLIKRKPTNFDVATQLTGAKLPVWGTCPRGEAEITEPEPTPTPTDPTGYIGDWMELSGGLSMGGSVPAPVYLISNKEMTIDWGPGVVNTTTMPQIITEATETTEEVVLHLYVTNYNIDPSEIRIKVKPLGNGPLVSFSTMYLTTVDKWYKGGYVNNPALNPVEIGMGGLLGSMISKVPPIAPPNTADFTGLCFGSSATIEGLESWDVSNITNMRLAFASAPMFNSDISNWDVSSVTNMDNMFADASSFNKDLSQWCVANITSLPTGFIGEDYPVEFLPVWGTCPRGENAADNQNEHVRIVAFSDALKTQLVYGEFGATSVDLPTIADVEQVQTSAKLLKFTEGMATLSIDYSKACPFAIINLSGGDFRYVHTHVPFYGVVVNNSVLQTLTANIGSETILATITAGTEGESMVMPLPADQALEMLGGGFTFDANYTIPMMPLSITNMIFSAFSYYTMFKVELHDVNTGAVTAQTGMVYDPNLWTPSAMNNFRLPYGDSIEIQLDKSIIAVGAVFASRRDGDSWVNAYRTNPVPVENTFLLEGDDSPLYHGVVSGNTITITDSMEGELLNRGSYDVGIWIFIPDEQVNIVSVSKDIQMDVKHFTNGTAIYMYLAAI